MHVFLLMRISSWIHTAHGSLKDLHWKRFTYGCEDHRLKTMNDSAQEKRSADAMKLCEERKLLLRNLVADAGKEDYAYGDPVSDITELFLIGETIGRNPESLGSSSKSLTTLFWNQLVDTIFF